MAINLGSRRRYAGIAVLLLLVAGCAHRRPLDPRTGDTGGPLSENERATDVVRYELTLEVFPGKRSIRGTGLTVLRAATPLDRVEIQLDPRFDVAEVRVDDRVATFTRDGGIITVSLPQPAAAGDEVGVSVRYRGRPHVAERPPWDGGFVWGETEDGQPWIATAVQGEGCDLWWPCKDHFRDKPERIDFHVTVPQGLSVALNGVLQSVSERPDGRRTFHWVVGVPISDYNVSLNIGPFVRIETTFESVNGTTVPIEFWALRRSEQDARKLIEEDLRFQLDWYEATLGPYPWGGEKLGIVQTPHLGMEHQTLNAYGNQFRRDDHGFDWLLHHELAHEWFGNLMTHQRLNDAWLHEGFGLYMQPAYSLHRYGEAAYLHTLYDRYLRMENCVAVVPEGDPTSDEAFTGDIYVKGAWTLHTLRWLIGEQAFWRAARRLLYDTAEPWKLPYPIAPLYRSTDDFVRIAEQESGRDLAWMFDVYLREADLPELIVERSDDRLTLTWQVPGERRFPMPVPLRIDDVMTTVEMPEGRTALSVAPEAHVIVDPRMEVLRRLPIIGDCDEMRAKNERERRRRR